MRNVNNSALICYNIANGAVRIETTEVEALQTVLNAGQWLLGCHDINSVRELVILCGKLGVKCPRCVVSFRYSKSPDHLCCVGAYRVLKDLLRDVKERLLADDGFGSRSL